ncbi:serine protease [Mesorhizobium sp. M0998]|uniref:S1 family peptidase n=1 Tax=Mesorhizobium sp. M0998 TaxID=2957044 RepID=UPI003339F8B5
MGNKGNDTKPGIDNLVRSAGALLFRGGTLESSGGSEPIADSLLIDAVAGTIGKLAASQAADDSGAQAKPKDRLVAKSVVGRAQAALEKVRDKGLRSLSRHDVSALEIIVYTVGRPALRYRNGRVEVPPNKLGDNSRWFVLVATERENINRVSGCVGRVGREQGPVNMAATGWRVGQEFIVTNRHVARDLVVDRNNPVETWTTDATKKPYIDFAYTDDTAGPARFNVGELIFCAPEDDVDLAIFRVVAGNIALPPAIPIDWSESTVGRTLPAAGDASPAFQGGEIYAVGHPYRAVASAQTSLVFEEADGRKRWSPGLVTGVDPQRPIMFHDSSTLAGSSGSCVVGIAGDGRHVAVGLHYGGKELATNKGSGLGSANYAVAFSRLCKHAAAKFLRGTP